MGLTHLFVSILLLNRSVKKIILYILLRKKVGLRLLFYFGEGVRKRDVRVVGEFILGLD